MSDRRTRRQKLQAMAAQSVSPHEAEIARRKLGDLPPEPPPPPKRVGGPLAWSAADAGLLTYADLMRAYEAIKRQGVRIVNDPEPSWRVKRRHKDATGRVTWEWEEP